MDKNKIKKRKSFVDLSDDFDDNFDNGTKTQEKTTKEIINIHNEINQRTKNIDEIESNDDNLEKFESESSKKNNVLSKKTTKISKEKINENSFKENKKEVKINESFQIFSEESLDKGFHFYSNDRVMNKVKKLAKSKNIKLSKLITMILDKAIKEE
ncbi:hypothetical protein [Mycoplasmoides pirum]|uniref:hypothetical protein n=1 Tax=Mycoplasmoides pirum TaxID=2122 RepID=UPI000488437C|nr:hypothetical protein [Mycoplasmoides pirum]